MHLKGEMNVQHVISFYLLHGIIAVSGSRGSLIFSQPFSCGVYTQFEQLNCNPTSPTDKKCSVSGTDQDGFLCSGSGILRFLKPAEKV